MKFLYLSIFVAICGYRRVLSHKIEQDNIQSDQLIFVQVISRHGARSPMQTYPKDPYKEGVWKKGFGQLTELGVNQTIELGQYLRHRYVEGDPFKLLNESYNREEIYVRSSDVDRTLMSAIGCMGGLYPPYETHLNPIPVHTVSSLNDGILYIKCPLRESIFEEVLHSDEVESTRLANVDYFRLLEKDTSMVMESFESVKYIADNILCVRAHDLPLPNWADYNIGNSTSVEYLTNMMEFYTNIRFNRRNQAKLIAGSLLEHLVDSMQEKIKNNSYIPKKAKFYFTHDTNIAALLVTMGVFNEKIIPFTATIIMELYGTQTKDDDDDDDVFNIKILYRNSTQEPPHVLRIPGCQEKCPLHTFLDLTQHNFITNWQSECIEEEPKNRDYLLLALGCTCVALFIVTILTVTFAVVRHRSNIIYRKYVDVPTEIE